MPIRRRKILVLLLGGILAVFPFSVWAFSRLRDGHPEGPPPSRPLLERAVLALGGRERLAAVRTMAIEARGREHGRPMEIQLFLELPGGYRQDVDTGDAHLVHAIQDGEAWATLDGLAVPLGMDEVRRLEEQVALQRLSLLVGIESDDRLSVTAGGEHDGLAWLEARIGASRSGVYALGFDPGTALLARAEWRASFHGHREPLAVVAALEDYREVDGIMVPYLATYRVGDQTLGETRIRSVRFGTAAPEGFFAKPPAEGPVPIHRRATTGKTALVVEGDDLDPRDALKRIEALARELKLDRNGPSFRMVDAAGARVVQVGLPIEPPVPPVVLPGGEGRPRIVEVPPEEALTVVIAAEDEDAADAARARLREEAARGGLAAGEVFRHVVWTAEIEQVQLPLGSAARGGTPR